MIDIDRKRNGDIRKSEERMKRDIRGGKRMKKELKMKLEEQNKRNGNEVKQCVKEKQKKIKTKI